MAAKTTPNDQVLPTKENQLFKSIVKAYENKMYKKGLKAADTILRKFPNHGETLSMKGLTLSCMDRKEEAYDLVRRGLKANLTSHVCWHVYGLLYRGDRNYTEAIKCYKNALKHDKDNQQILRDLSLLQIQLRDIEGFMETRRKLLSLKPSQKGNWISFAMSHHLAKDYQQAIKILNEYRKTEADPKVPEYEHSELILYINSIIAESGDYQAALTHLEEHSFFIVDKLSYKETRAEYLAILNKNSLAVEQYRDLITVNSDNFRYHYGLLKAAQIVVDDKVPENKVEEFVKLYDELSAKFPRSDTVATTPLKYLTGNHFQTRTLAYLKARLRKGIPSLFVSMRSLYSDPAKVKILDEIIHTLVKNLETIGKYSEDGNPETPAALLWAKTYLAQHYDHLGNTQLALKTIDEAIAHTPTVVELYSIKGRFWKHAGDLERTSLLFEQSRELDLADRYLNTKSVIYLLRNDQRDKAKHVVGLFTKEGEDPELHLTDMQASWYNQELGESYFRTGDYALALKKFTQIEKYFLDFIEDQFDFHTYCVRKMTLRAYLSVLQFEDNIYGHKFFTKAAKFIVQIYLHLVDNPIVKKTSEVDEALAKLSEEERKKFLSKQRKEERKRAEEEKAKAEKQQHSHEKKRPVDPDPEGKALVEGKDFLAEATKYLEKLLLHNSKDVETHILACQVYLKKKKFILALRSLLKALALAPTNPEVHKQKILILSAIEQNIGSLNPKVQSVIEAERVKLLGGKILADLNKQLLEKDKSLAARFAVGQALFHLSPSSKAEVLQLVTSVENEKGLAALKESVKIHQFLLSTLKDESAANAFREKCNKVFPYATYFLDATQKEAREKELRPPPQPADENSTPEAKKE